jgi:N-acetylglucosaminyldiphosphoundecaprenol N-acetyl-beta-D-mannosaminyltransferase
MHGRRSQDLTSAAPQQIVPPRPEGSAARDLRRVTIGNACIHALGPAAAADLVCQLVRRGRGQLVVTPNISHIALLERRQDFREAYRRAALVVPDGWPVARAMTVLGGRRQLRVNGTELALAVTQRAAQQDLSLAIVGGVSDAADRCAAVLRQRYPQLRVVLVDRAPQQMLAEPSYVEDLLARVSSVKPDILLLGLGAPKQELFATSREVDAGVILAVGSSIELIAGVRRRAPAAWRRLGLEWLHRTIQEPRRLAPRYLRDAPIFLIVLARAAYRRGRAANAE